MPKEAGSVEMTHFTSILSKCTFTTKIDSRRTETGMCEATIPTIQELRAKCIRWVLAVDSTIANLTSHPSSRPDLTFVAAFDGTTLELVSEHLACFDGGNIILGGLVLGRQDYVDYGLELVNGCHDTYNSTATGIGPEEFSWDPTAIPADQAAFYNSSGFYITDAVYDLRPEVLESYYYAYRATGNTTYQDWSFEGIMAVNASTRTDSGFSLISDVNAPGGGEKLNLQESFLFAEVLKYAYLIQAPVSCL